MKLSTALNILVDLRLAIFAGLLPTLKCLWHTPALIFSPITISRLFMSFVWAAFANGIDENSRTIKDDLITPNARGVVLDIGSGECIKSSQIFRNSYFCTFRFRTYCQLSWPGSHKIYRVGAQPSYAC